jgi:sugar phosphate isomerase/epimerase
MRIGVFTALWGDLSFEGALDKAVEHGVKPSVRNGWKP